MTFQNRARAAAVLCLFALDIGAAHAREPWIVLKDSRLEENESNDADSFHVKAGRKDFIFRLYFADAPETAASFPERIAEQAKYFGATAQQTVQLGNLAKKFTHEKLAQPFTVRTCRQDAMGRSKKERFYAFVETSEGDLAELLVANGLARVHGRAAAPEGLNSPQREKQKLQRLEREAKAQKVGGWGAASGRMTVRLPRQPAKTGVNSFDAFFHPERVASPAEADAVMETPAAPATAMTIQPRLAAVPPPQRPANASAISAAPGKLDVNSATVADLMSIRGVGPVLAQRIIDARPLKSADDLRNVKGIGAKTYEKIRSFFSDEQAPGPAVSQ